MALQIFQKALYVPLVARVCTSTKDLNEVVKKVNEKYKDGKELYKFFENVFLNGNDTKQWHLSPFGLVWDRGDAYETSFKGQEMYSLRHLIEQTIDCIQEPEIVKKILYKQLKSTQLERIKNFEEFYIKESVYYNIPKKEIRSQKIYIQEEPEGLGFYICWEGCSRVATHQLIRHQSFDFQQQSQRYINYEKTKGDFGFYIPNKYCQNPSKLNKYIDQQLNNYKLYKDALKYSKPEDARFYLSNAFTSRIIFFAPKERVKGRDGIKEFIEKRKKHGQEEIKNFALTLEKILK